MIISSLFSLPRFVLLCVFKFSLSVYVQPQNRLLIYLYLNFHSRLRFLADFKYKAHSRRFLSTYTLPFDLHRR
jgi:hypothetical protein